MKRTIGLIVNPVAGMGGSVVLKGTDGEMYKKALELGAKPVTSERTKDILSHIRHKDRIALFVAPGKMGERHFEGTDMPYKVIGKVGGDTSAEDTKRISEEKSVGRDLNEKAILDLDRLLSGYMEVTVGYKEKMMVEVRC